jgi:small subunit ribosomal protein S2
MPFVTERWLGGMLTNFATIRKSLKKLQQIEKLMKDENFSNLAKRERLTISREKAKLEKLLGGIADLNRLPAALFVIDVKREHIAVAEAL